MVTSIPRILGTMVALSIMVIAMCCWNNAMRWSSLASRPDVAYWAIRSAAIGFGAAAQALAITFIVRTIDHRRHRSGNLFRLFSGVVAAVALISAAALGLAGR